MEVLVTGGAGFIGSNLVRTLVNLGEYDVTVLDDFSSGYEANLRGLESSIRVFRGDIRDAELVDSLMRRTAVVFHLAARVGNVRSLSAPVQDAEINIIGTRILLEAARKYEGIRVIYSSSAAGYGEPKYLPQDEIHPTNPDSPYGVSKMAAEKDVLCYGRLFALPVYCLRYFNVYGQNQRYDAYGNVIPIFVERILNRKDLVVYGDGLQTRDFVHVEDVVQANLLCLHANLEPGVFNIGTGTGKTINHLVDSLGVIFGHQIEVRHAPPRPGDVRHSYANIARARECLGYAPRVTVDKGLVDYVTWYKSYIQDGRTTL